MDEIVRYQGLVLDGTRVLLIKHQEHNHGRAYWLLPGGGRDPGESEEECVRREMLEETHLEVRVERLVLETLNVFEDARQYCKTYLCSVVSGEPAPGYEPEEVASSKYAISEVGWFDLVDEATWNDLIRADPITRSVLRKLRAVLRGGPHA